MLRILVESSCAVQTVVVEMNFLGWLFVSQKYTGIVNKQNIL